MRARGVLCICLAQGEQVFISYGNQGNDHLLQFYGFVEPDNPWDRYTIDRLASHGQAGIRLPERVVLTCKGPDAETLAALLQLNPGVELSAKGSNPIYKVCLSPAADSSFLQRD